MLGEKIERVGEEHFGRAIATENQPSLFVFYVPISIDTEDHFSAIRYNKDDKPEIFHGYYRCQGWHYWLPDPKPEQKKPSERLAGANTLGVRQLTREILDEHHDQLKALDERLKKLGDK